MIASQIPMEVVHDTNILFFISVVKRSDDTIGMEKTDNGFSGSVIKVRQYSTLVVQMI